MKPDVICHMVIDGRTLISRRRPEDASRGKRRTSAASTVQRIAAT